MFQIIVYDIPDDGLRTRVSRTLQDFGYERVQYSVFFGSRTQNSLEELSLILQEIIKKEEADVRFYQICNTCSEKTMIVSRIGEEEMYGGIFAC
ncbi:MAG: putative CRISPR-associated endoribonuclease Cas2 1 [Candidatus Thorarchaeota archaeon]|nr:MAG: putative CRISPR-associated endoribonuclease Cas2 1 [Candidatus Thorarchaeota archaeon]